MGKTGARPAFDLELVFLTGVAAFMAVFLSQSFSYTGLASKFPRLVSAIGLVLSSYALAGKIRAPRGSETGESTAAGGPEPEGARSVPRIPWYLFVLFLLGYLALIVMVGFGPATLVALGLLGRLLGMRRWGLVALFAVTSTVVLMLMFGWLFHTPLPVGLVGKLLGR